MTNSIFIPAFPPHQIQLQPWTIPSQQHLFALLAQPFSLEFPLMDTETQKDQMNFPTQLMLSRFKARTLAPGVPSWQPQ